MSSKEKEQTSSLLNPEITTDAQEFVEAYSFAGYSNGAQAKDGEPLFWRTQTVRGPGSFAFSDNEGSNVLEVRDGTVVAVHSAGRTQLTIFSAASKKRFGTRALSYTQYSLEELPDGPTLVTQEEEGEVHKPWLIPVKLGKDSFAKVVQKDEVNSTVGDRYDSLTLSDEQSKELGVVFNAMASILQEQQQALRA